MTADTLTAPAIPDAAQIRHRVVTIGVLATARGHFRRHRRQAAQHEAVGYDETEGSWMIHGPMESPWAGHGLRTCAR